MKPSTLLTAVSAGFAVTSDQPTVPQATTHAAIPDMKPAHALSVRSLSTRAPAGRNALNGVQPAKDSIDPAVAAVSNPHCVPGWEKSVATGTAIAGPLAGMAGGLLGAKVGATFDTWTSGASGHHGEAIGGAIGTALAAAGAWGWSGHTLVEADQHGVCQPDCITDAGHRATTLALWGTEVISAAAGGTLGAMSGAELAKFASPRVQNVAPFAGAVAGGSLGFAAVLAPARQRIIENDGIGLWCAPAP